jgi:iron complex transport system substrate-binding protein
MSIGVVDRRKGIDSQMFSRRQVISAVPAAALTTRFPDLAFAQEIASPVADGPWIFTDDRGRTITLPKRPERVVAQVTAAATLWDYGIRPIAIYGPQRKADGTLEPLAGEIDLDAVESLGETWEDFDIEKLIALKADLLIAQSYGDQTLWYLEDDVRVLVEQVVPTIGIWAIDVPLGVTINRFEELAVALGADPESPENVANRAAFTAAESNFKEVAAAKQDVSVVALGCDTDYVYVANPRVATDLQYYAELGMNLVPIETEYYWEELSWERANSHPCDLILFDNRSGAEALAIAESKPVWQQLPAVIAGQVGTWYAEPLLSRKAYARILDAMAAGLAAARGDVV